MRETATAFSGLGQKGDEQTASHGRTGFAGRDGEAERFLTHRWVRRVLLCRSMELAAQEAVEQELGPPAKWGEHLASGAPSLRSGLLESLPAEVVGPQAARHLALWRRWDAENWGRALAVLACQDPVRVCHEVTLALEEGEDQGAPRGPAVPWMLLALVRSGPAGREVAYRWARLVRRCGVPLEYLWSGFFGAMAQMEAPGLGLMVIQALQAFEPGAREVDCVLENLFQALAPGLPAWELVHGMRRGAGYLMEDLPELFHESSEARSLDGVLLDASRPDLALVGAMLPTRGRNAGLLTVAGELVRLASMRRWETHADRIATFALAAACAECLRAEVSLEAANVPEMLGLLSAEISVLPGEDLLLQALVERMEPRHDAVMCREMEQARSPAGLARLVRLVRRKPDARHVRWLVSLLGRRYPAQVGLVAAGGLVELGPRVVPELERAFDSLDFDGKGRCLDVLGFLKAPEVGAALSRRLRGALADTELLDHWALAASYAGHQELVVAARRWGECAPWPLGAMADAAPYERSSGSLSTP